MSDNLVVACVNVQDYCGRGWEYVRKLRAGLARHLPVAHTFVCVTDEFSHPVVVSSDGRDRKIYLPSVPDVRGWWQKVGLFRPGFLPPGRVLYFDLDTVIVGDLSPLAEPRPFSMLTDFIRGTPSSAIMAWPEGFGADIWAAYEAQEFPQKGGDQDWIAANAPKPLRLQDSVDGLLASWIHCEKGLPDGARAVSFWGPRRPHECNGWVNREWVE